MRQLLASARQGFILEQVRLEGQVTVAALSRELQVSDETIRRDIGRLDSEGLLHKVHGGAVSIPGNCLEEVYEKRLEQNVPEKMAIAACAAGLVRENDVIGLDTGATIDWLCRVLPDVKNLTVITASVSALNILMERVQNGEIHPRIIFLGGEVNCENRYTQGHMTTQALQRFSLDKCFVAATAVSLSGISMYDLYDGEYSAALIGQSASSCYLGASEKTGKEALMRVCGLEKLRHFITDDCFPIPAEMRRYLDTVGVSCHIVSVCETGTPASQRRDGDTHEEDRP